MQLILLALAMVALYGTNGPLISMAMLYAKGPAVAPSIGVFNTIINSGGLLGPIVLGLISESTGSYTGGFLCMGVLIATSGVLAIFAPRPKLPR